MWWKTAPDRFHDAKYDKMMQAYIKLKWHLASRGRGYILMLYGSIRINLLLKSYRKANRFGNERWSWWTIRKRGWTVRFSTVSEFDIEQEDECSILSAIQIDTSMKETLESFKRAEDLQNERINSSTAALLKTSKYGNRERRSTMKTARIYRSLLPLPASKRLCKSYILLRSA